MFDKDSGLVRIWLNLIASGAKTYADVPEISNLREVVAAELEDEE